MKLTKHHSRPTPDTVFGRLQREMGHRAYITWFAEDDLHTGVGSTPAEAVKNLRSNRSRRVRDGYRKPNQETP